ncbi:unnamed protein product [Adineta steineri]|uniref:Uncharacterized protein n=1 Tax=Adineta steineri TaxID=433720 RepID=A0A814S1R8_9BILA|nr:unnamed protein product [Adineta steineri]CAF1147411.1 unnamed protein product [Adineta steineri]CAF1447317.1 unnamed protein product [Adineta steineri]
MASSFQTRSIQALNNRNQKMGLPPMKRFSKTANDEALAFGRMPFSAMRTSLVTNQSVPSSPGGIIKPTPMNQKRSSSVISLGNIFPSRKSLQTTALATRRQSLWMNIAKNAPPPSIDTQPPILPLGQEPSNLMRKKILRLLLVFSYLLSISLLAIALTTFYGFFWSGYGTPPTITTLSDVKITAQSLITATSNSTFVSEIENVS